jgi:hypothetical protein
MVNPSTKIMELLLRPDDGFAYWGYFDDYQKNNSGFKTGNWVGSNIPILAYTELQLAMVFISKHNLMNEWIEFSEKEGTE